MDVICVEDPNYRYHCTEFYLKYRVPIVDETLLTILGENDISAAVMMRDSFPSVSEEQLNNHTSVEQSIYIKPVLTENMNRGESPSIPSSSNSNTGSAPSSSSLNQNTKTTDNSDSKASSKPISSHTSSLSESSTTQNSNKVQWCEIYVNGILRSDVIAFVGPGQFIYFYDPTKNRYHTTPSRKILSLFNLEYGKNHIHCVHVNTKSSVSFHIWVYRPQDRLVIMDIDGTITKSDVTGYITTVFMGTYSYVHEGIVDFLNYVKSKYNYHIVYLTARPNAHRKPTSDLLRGVQQTPLKDFGTTAISSVSPFEGDSSDKEDISLKSTRREIDRTRLPDGPLLMNKDRIMLALFREVVLKDTVFAKCDVLSQISEAFRGAGMTSLSPFALGVGNKEHDALAYNSSGMSTNRIFLINPSSQLSIWKFKQQLLNPKSTSVGNKKDVTSSQANTSDQQVQPEITPVKAKVQRTILRSRSHQINTVSAKTQENGSSKLVKDDNDLPNVEDLETTTTVTTDVMVEDVLVVGEAKIVKSSDPKVQDVSTQDDYDGPITFTTYADPNFYKYLDLLSTQEIL